MTGPGFETRTHLESHRRLCTRWFRSHVFQSDFTLAQLAPETVHPLRGWDKWLDAVATRRRLFASLPLLSPRLLPPLPHSVQAQTPRLALSLPTMLVSVSLPLPPLVPLRLAPSPSQPASPERRVPPHDTRARAPPRPHTAPQVATTSLSGTAHAPGGADLERMDGWRRASRVAPRRIDSTPAALRAQFTLSPDCI